MSFSELVDNYKEFMLDDPIVSTNAGIHTKDHLLPEITRERFAREVQNAEVLLSELKRIKKEDLDFEQQIDCDLMVLALEKVVFCNRLEYNGLFDFEQMPNAGSTLINAFMYLFLKDPRGSKVRLDAITERAGRIPCFFSKYKSTLSKVVRRWKNIEVEELQSIVDLFENIVSWAEMEKYERLDELKQNVNSAKSAIDDYLSSLNSLEVIENFSIGAEMAQKLVNLNGIELTLDEIFNVAKEFFKEHNTKINELVNELKQKYGLEKNKSEKEVIQFVKEKFAVPIDQVVPQYQKEQERIMEFLKESEYFSLPKSDKLIIMKTPSYLVPSIPVGAMFPPAPFENGPKTSVVYLTIDEGRQKDQNSLMITNTMIHEGIPGHHLQFAIAYEHHSIVRKIADYNTHAEGWTTYLEGFMCEEGFIEADILSEYKLIAFADFARLGARVGIDLYFMTGDDKYLNVIEGFTPEGSTAFEKAKSLLQKATGFSDARAEGELNWYSKGRCYPMCYLLGNKIVLEMVQQIMEKSHDKKEARKLFHKAYLEEGSMPLGMLKKVLEHNGIL